MKVLLIDGKFYTDNDERKLLMCKTVKPCDLTTGFGNLKILIDDQTGAVDTFFHNLEDDLIYLVDCFNPYRE